jgi:hypothetical protein
MLLFGQFEGLKIHESLWQVDVCLGLLDTWILDKKRTIRWVWDKDLALRTSFRDNSLITLCICFLSICVAMPTLWCCFKVTPFFILYCLWKMFVLWCPVLASLCSVLPQSPPCLSQANSYHYVETCHNKWFSLSSVEVGILEYICHFTLKFWL